MKAAGTSLEASLRAACSNIDIITQGTTEEVLEGLVGQNNTDCHTGKPIFHSHTWPDLLYRSTLSAWEGYKKITVCRNPWDACVSYYWWSMQQTKNSQILIREKDSPELAREKFRLFLETHSEFDLPSQISELSSFEKPCKWLAEISRKFIDPSIGTYLRYESLQKDFDELSDSLDIPKEPLSRFKSTQRVLKKSYQYYYDDHTRSVVSESFLDLIDFFGYKF